MKTNHLLRRERQQRSWTQQQVAESIGTTALSVGRWERGITFPSPHFRQALCALFNKNPEELSFVAPDEDVPYDDDVPQMLEEIIDIENNSSIFSILSAQNRYQIIKNMYGVWIEGVLESSIQIGNLIPLELEVQRRALADPWRLRQPTLKSASLYLSAGKIIEKTYDEAGGALLILGEPGSGKTTLLLELTRILLERAEADVTHPLPIVFNVSSWDMQKQSFLPWLVEELETYYQIPQDLGYAWVTSEQMIPLLDGLDEIPASEYSCYLKAINSYRQEHGLQPFVICSRSTDYFEQPIRLLIQRAVAIQPLAPQFLDGYLAGNIERFGVVRQALKDDPSLQALIVSPAMLNILIEICAEQESFHGFDEFHLEKRRHMIITSYMRRILRKRDLVPVKNPRS